MSFGPFLMGTLKVVLYVLLPSPCKSFCFVPVCSARERMTYAGNSSVERAVDASEYAFEPKDVKSQKKSVVPTRVSPTEAEIKDRINRLYGCLADKELTARLPDNGLRIQEKIAELQKELDIIGMKNEIIDFG